MIITRPKPKIKPHRELKNDMASVIPVTLKGEIILIELKIPKLGTRYRIPEIYFPRQEKISEETAEKTLELAGIFSSKIKLLKKEQPMNFGEYPFDHARYHFAALEAEIVDKPKLDFLVPHSLKIKSVSFVKKELYKVKPSSRKIENMEHGDWEMVENLLKNKPAHEFDVPVWQY